MFPQPILKFLRKGLGLKNLVDYIESRQEMLGLTKLNIQTVIDVGTNKGRRARSYRRRFPEATIHCVEPIPDFCRRLNQWAQTQTGKVQVWNLALSNLPAQSTFYVNKKDPIWSTLLKPEGQLAEQFDEISVKVDTLDHLAESLELTGDVLVKVDAEGFDLEVIRGGKQTLQRSAAIIVETMFFPTRYGDQSPTFEDILAALSELGYVYRGNVCCGWLRGTCFGADALFVRKEAALRIAA
ncbi:MAG: FkbM family methyltransferase [Pirellulales bacterium]|nr:FkbM family methyltransferase [Pirellulales bacterium]